MCEPIVQDLLMLEKGFHVYDSFLRKEVFVIAPVLCFLCDNARASELSNHLGSTARKLCRMCMVCLTYRLIMYDSYYRYQTSDATVLGELCTKELALLHIEEIAAQQTKKDKSDLQKKYGLREKPNPLFDLSIDIFRYST